MLWKGLLRSTTKIFYNYWGWSAKNGEKRTSNVHSKPRTVLKHKYISPHIRKLRKISLIKS